MRTNKLHNGNVKLPVTAPWYICAYMGVPFVRYLSATYRCLTKYLPSFGRLYSDTTHCITGLDQNVFRLRILPFIFRHLKKFGSSGFHVVDSNGFPLCPGSVQKEM